MLNSYKRKDFNHMNIFMWDVFWVKNLWNNKITPFSMYRNKHTHYSLLIMIITYIWKKKNFFFFTNNSSSNKLLTHFYSSARPPLSLTGIQMSDFRRTCVKMVMWYRQFGIIADFSARQIAKYRQFDTIV